MKLAVFDIDGTLTDTNDIDTACYVEALEVELGMRDVDTDWSAFQNTTDRGILAELIERVHGRPPTPEEIAAHRRRFVALLAERMRDAREIPGAIAFLDRVQAAGWSVVLCTGAWSDSARLKLTRAGFPADLRIASCADAPSRSQIVRNGIANAGGPFERIVVFGDAVWDLRAARDLALPFIGVGSRSGGEHTIDDYTDSSAVLRLMGEARAPR